MSRIEDPKKGFFRRLKWPSRKKNHSESTAFSSLTSTPQEGSPRITSADRSIGSTHNFVVKTEEKTGGVRHEGIANTETKCMKGSLWEKAYNKLQIENPDLVKEYENGLLAIGITSDRDTSPIPDASASKEHLLTRLVQRKLNDIQGRQSTLSLGSKRFVIRDEIRRIVHAIIAVKDVIYAACSNEPHASIAWAGILLILPIFLNPITQDEAATSGFAYISNLLIRCRFMEEHQFGGPKKDQLRKTDSGADLSVEVENEIVDMYQQILQYQMRLAKYYSYSTLMRCMRDIAVVDDWKAMLESIKVKDKSITDDLNRISQSTINHISDYLSRLSQDVESLLKESNDDIKDVRKAELLGKLHAVTNAAFDSYAQGDAQCLEGTQSTILERIQSWLDHPNAAPIFWLHGMAGTGKSTIARTVALAIHRMTCLVGQRPLPGDILLGATFFFNRTDTKRNNARALFPTLAAQLADEFPILAKSICGVIKDNFDIADGVLATQWKSLILGPLKELGEKSISPVTILLVIDALDECQPEAPERLGMSSNEDDIQIIIKLLAQARDLENVTLRVFITSRPTNEIAFRFRGLSEDDRDDETLCKVPLPQKGGLRKDDITRFIENELPKIRDMHQLPTTWPGADNIRQLVLKTDGLFIYAATACRFLRRIGVDIEDRLSMIFESEIDADSPQRYLDQLYSGILRAEVLGDLTQREKSKRCALFKTIVGSILVLADSVSIPTLSELISCKVGTVGSMLRCLNSVLSVTPESSYTIQLLHLSFRDFLLGHERCVPEFWVDESAANLNLFDRCLDIMSALHRNICNLGHLNTHVHEVQSLEHYIPCHVQYACSHWVDHLEQGHVQLADGDKLHRFLEVHFTHWVEAMSLTRNMATGILILDRVLHYVKKFPLEGRQNFTLFIQDAKRFMLQFKPLIEEAPLQIYVSALTFAPQKSITRQNFVLEIPKWITRPPLSVEGWDARLQVLEVEQQWVLCHDFSHDSTLLAGALFDRVYIWDTSTWKCLQTLDDDLAISISFSPDNTTFATGRGDGIVTMWSLATQEGNILYHGSLAALDLMFSTDGVFFSFCEQGVHHVWKLEGATWHPKIRVRRPVDEGSSIGQAFPANNRRMIIGWKGVTESCVQLWNLDDGTLLQSFHTSNDIPISIAASGKMAAWEPHRKTFLIWDPDSTHLQCELDLNIDDCRSVVLSQDGNCLCFISSNGDFQLNDLVGGSTRSFNAVQHGPYDPINDQTIGLSCKGGSLAVLAKGQTHIIDTVTGNLSVSLPGMSLSSIRFSPNGELCAFKDGTAIHVCDLQLHGSGVSTGGVESRKTLGVRFSCNGKWAIIASYSAVEIWEVETTTLVSTIPERDFPYADLPYLACMEDGQRLLLVGDRRSGVIIDTHTWARSNAEFIPPGQGSRLTQIAVGPRLLAIASYPHKVDIEIWDKEDLTLMKQFPSGILGEEQNTIPQLPFSGPPPHPGQIALAISPDQSLLALMHVDSSKCQVWNIEEERLVSQIDNIGDCPIWSPSRELLSFTPDNKLIILARHSIQIFDASTGQKLAEVATKHPTNSIALSKDGTLLHTNKGTFDIASILDKRESEAAETGLYVNKGWLIEAGRETILLPLEYRPNDEFTAFHEGTLAFISQSGQLMMTELGEIGDRLLD